MSVRLVVALSGGGRSFENLWRQQENGSYVIRGVISSNAHCRGLALARELGIPVFVDGFSSGDKSATERIEEWLKHVGVDWIALAGFIKKFPEVAFLRDRVVNIHPALLPKYGGRGMYGIAVHRAVIEAGDAQSGASVHYVNDRYDEGRIISQIHVPVVANESPESLAERVFEAEKILYPQTLKELISGILPLPNGGIKIL